MIFKRNKNKKKMQERAITVYFSKVHNELFDVVQDNLNEYMESFNEVSSKLGIIKLKDTTDIEIHVSDDIEDNKNQADRMRTFFAQSPISDSKVMDLILKQIGKFNFIVGIKYKHDEENEARSKDIENFVYKIAKELNGYLLYPTMCLYTAEEKLMISKEGKSDLHEEDVQEENVEIDIYEEMSEEDIRRTRSTKRILMNKGLKYNEQLKVIVYTDAKVRKKEDIINKIIETFTLAHLGYINENYQSEIVMNQHYLILDNLYNISKFNLNYSKVSLENVEYCAMLLWTMHLYDIESENELSNYDKLSKIMFNHNYDSLYKNCILRSKEDLLEMHELYMRYDDALKNYYGKNILNEKAVVKRYEILKWILQL